MIRKALSSDIFGMGVSLLCVIHCLALPILFSAFPLIFHKNHNHTLFEAIFVGLMTLALLAFWKGYKIHKSQKALALAVVGVVIVTLSLFVNAHEAKSVISVIGASFFLLAHYWNYKLCKSSSCAVHHHH